MNLPNHPLFSETSTHAVPFAGKKGRFPLIAVAANRHRKFLSVAVSRKPLLEHIDRTAVVVVVVVVHHKDVDVRRVQGGGGGGGGGIDKEGGEGGGVEWAI